MIRTKQELSFYIKADRIMNGLPENVSIKELIINRLTGGGAIIQYLRNMRCYSYYKHQKGVMSHLKRFHYGNRFRHLGTKLGFSIGEDVFGYGLVIPHYGTIVIGGDNTIGNYAVLHTSTCISAKRSIIGDGLYLSTGSKITQQVRLGNGVMIGANSVVNKSFDDNLLIVGCPATVKKDMSIWYLDETIYNDRVKQIEILKEKLYCDA